MDKLGKLGDFLEGSCTWVRGFVQQNKLTASLIATNAALVTWYILWKTSRHKRLIDQIPGIKDYPFVGDMLSLSGDPCVFYEQMGDLVETMRDKRIMKMKILEVPWIVLFSAEEVETLLSSNELLDKAEDYRYLHSFLGMGILNSTGDQWRSRRKMLTPSFHFHILQDFLQTMNEASQSLVDKLQREACDTGVEYDIFTDLTLSSLDIICATAMGLSIDALNNGDSEYITSVCKIKDALGKRGREILQWYDVVFDNILPVGRETNRLIRLTHEFTNKVIKERRQQFAAGDYKSGKYRPLLDSLLQYKDENTGQGLSDEDIRAEVDTFMFEGHDTVSSGLGFATHLLGVHTDSQRLCQKELDEIMGGRKEITSADLGKMHYLDWCVKETIRIYPSVPIFGRQLTKDTVFAGYTVPRDTAVFIFTWCLHSDPKLYSDPHKFDPLRFKPENCVNRHPYSYIPFSAGPRNCIGQKYAMMELKVILASILLNFDVESTQTKEDLRPNPGMILQPTQGIRVKLTSRN